MRGKRNIGCCIKFGFKAWALVLASVLLIALILRLDIPVSQGPNQTPVVSDLSITPASLPAETGTQPEPTPDLVKARLASRVQASGEPVIAKITDAASSVAKYPVIYKGAKDGDYVVQYDDMLVIYDYGNDVIVNQLPITRIALG